MDHGSTRGVMFVKNLMAVGKSLILASSLLLLNQCASHTVAVDSQSTFKSVETVYDKNTSSANYVANFLKYKFYMLDDEDKEKQKTAIYFALNNLDNDIVTNWYNNRTEAQGQVKIVSSYPQGSGYCRVIFSQLIYRGKERSFSETACLEMGHSGWRFIK
jgi:surface antigen